ncbi:MAG: energy transducer TonB [Longimicrobiaceae bacterium]
MRIRRFVPVPLLLAAVALAFAMPASAQPAAGERAIAQRWRAAGADSVALERLFEATLRTGGPELFDAVLAAARDPERPQLVRVYALAALFAYARPEYGFKSRAILGAARDAGIVCEPNLTWAPGDTLRACVRSSSSWELPVRRPGAFVPPAALSADSARVEAIVAVARTIARGGRSPVAGAADLLLSGLGRFSTPRVTMAVAAAAACPASSPLPLPPGHTAVVDRDRVYPPVETTRAPTLANACIVSRLLARSYPPLARDAGEEGTVVLSLLVDPQGLVREASVERAAPRPEFGAAALRVVSRMRFIPVRRGTAPVATRVSVPIRFAFASEYPRVAVP